VPRTVFDFGKRARFISVLFFCLSSPVEGDLSDGRSPGVELAGSRGTGLGFVSLPLPFTVFVLFFSYAS
jgi:hypothetical protein